MGGVNVLMNIFLISALVVDERSASRPGRVIPGERASGTHWIGGGMDPRAGLGRHEGEKILAPTGT
jgi:hypothetical protein